MFVSCPHCNITIEIIELNCRIFRCGILKSTGQQIDPHLAKEHCDRLFEKGEIHGCGKPFKVDTQPDGSLVCYDCGYI
jgi:DNA-directed RNA polymerase subunit RPC12/RpoP